MLPHQWRIRLAGRLGASFLSPVLGWKDRIGENLDLVMPELSQADRAQLIRKVSNNITRVFIELFSPKDMEKIASVAPFEGPGVKALDAALSTGRPVICVSGHFGNYDVFRAALIQRGFDVGALYRPMNDQRFNRRYEKSISAVGGKMFPRGRQGFISMIQHLKGGGCLPCSRTSIWTGAPACHSSARPLSLQFQRPRWRSNTMLFSFLFMPSDRPMASTSGSK